MNLLRALRRLIANTDRLPDLASATEQLQLTVDELKSSVGRKLDRLQEAADNQSTGINERLDRLHQAVENQSAYVNERLDSLQQAIDNQSTAINERLDRIHQAADNQSNPVDERLDSLQQAIDNQSTAINERLGRLHQAADNQSAAVNERLDRLQQAIDNQSAAVGDRPGQLLQQATDNRAAGTNKVETSPPSAAGSDPDPPLISLMLLCYNQERFVGEAVDSALSQTYSPLEIVIIDDCSLDGTAGVIESKLAEHPRRANVRFIRNDENLNVLKVVPLGLGLTHGDFIVTVSGDDILLPDMVAEVAKVWREEQVSLVITNCSYIDENSNSLNRTHRDPDLPADDRFETLARDGVNACSFGPCLSFEREIYAKFGWAPEHLETADIIVPFYAYLLKGARFLNKVLFKYRVHQDNTSLSLIAEAANDSLRTAIVQERIDYCHFVHAVFMQQQLMRLRVEDPERYADLAAEILPLIDIQISERTRKFMHARSELKKRLAAVGT